MIKSAMLFAGALAAVPAGAQRPYDPAPRIAAQKDAMKPLSMLDGRWRGTAWTLMPGADGKPARHGLVQTERVGSFLGGAVKVIEGRGYEADGRIGFNAIGVVSFDPAGNRYSIQSNAMGSSGTFPFRVTEGGYAWETPAGPGTVIRYTATVANGKWREIGERVTPDGKAMQVFEMNLVRLGDTAWPAADPVPMND